MIKRLFLMTTLLLALVFLLPVFAVLRNAPAPAGQAGQSVYLAVETEAAEQTAPPERAAALSDSTVTVAVLTNNGTVNMPLDEYLFNVLAGEIEPTAPLETLKAQAVAARTFTYHRILGNRARPGGLHPETVSDAFPNGAEICADFNHCLAYRDKETAMEGWRAYTDAEANAAVFKRAIRETDGQVLLHNDDPIVAVFFSISSGRTEAAADVWGSDIPYLQSVYSPGEDVSPGFHETVTLTHEEFKTAAALRWPGADFSGAPSGWIADITRSPAGGIVGGTIGGVPVRGTELRAAFGLRSHNIVFRADDENIVMETRGYGHGVGLSQFGATVMGLEGAAYEEILAHYYTGTVLGRYVL
jgi:stage II sporulation protein D